MRTPPIPAAHAAMRFDATGVPDGRPQHRLIGLLDPGAAAPGAPPVPPDEIADWFESVLADLEGATATH